MSAPGSSDGKGQLLLYAPNVHTGGGLVLLRALLHAWPAGQQLVAWLDRRARDLLALPPSSDVVWVDPSLSSRLHAERSLASAGKEGNSILCFHGLPPLLPNRAGIILFQQNRNYLGQVDLSRFSFRTRLRLRGEQFVSKVFRHRVHAYWVQTPSMARSLKAWFGEGDVDIEVLPFATPFESGFAGETKDYDFVYVADGEAHKNHRTLVEAWIRLKRKGHAPSLAFTLSQRDLVLKHWIEEQVRVHGLRIDDLGVMPHAEVAKLYGRSRALVFPSLSESFGLPLIEASAMGLPILAGELDFVRDVCTPAVTFDPTSAVSIERAVLRHIGQPEMPATTASAADFLHTIMASR